MKEIFLADYFMDDTKSSLIQFIKNNNITKLEKKPYVIVTYKGFKKHSKASFMSLEQIKQVLICFKNKKLINKERVNLLKAMSILENILKKDK